MDSIDKARVPPHSIEAEQSVIGGMLIDNSSADSVIGFINADSFYRRDHQLIFNAIITLVSSQQAVDIITLSEYLDRQNILEQTGGTAYLAELSHNTPTAANILRYASIVRERSLMRELINVGTEIAKLGFEPGELDSRELTEKSEQMVFQLAEQQIKTSSFRNMKVVLDSLTDTLEELSKIEGNITGVPTGLIELDNMTAGLQKGDLIILAGRPSMGKTTLAMNVVEYAARFHTVVLDGEKAEPTSAAVGVFSMEMDAEQLAMRLVSSMGLIPLKNIRSGKIDNKEFTDYFKAAGTLKKTQIFIDDSSGLTAFELRARARRLKRDNPNLSLIVVDYLQLLNSASSREENRATEITQISRLLKEMARELNIPVVVLSQLNRSVEKRTDRRPIMSDLRESGSIEQDADVIMFVHREEVYEPKKEELKGEALLIVAKQRNGEIGDLRLRFEGKFTRFDNPSVDDAPFPQTREYFPDL